MAGSQTLKRRARLGELGRPALVSTSLFGLLHRLERQHDGLQVVGQIVVNPGDTTKTVSLPFAFVNPTTATRDLGATMYGEATH